MKSFSYDFYDDDILFACFVFKYCKLYIKRGYLHRLDEIKDTLADNGFIMLNWEEVK